MLDYGFANFALVQPELPADSNVPVKLGVSDFASAVPAQETKLLIDKAQRGSVTTEVTLEESVTAPVSLGQRLGTLRIKAGEQILTEVPMVAQDAVPRLSYGQVIIRVLKQVAMAKNF